ncbi:MAG: hypothetical protein CSA39_04505 [Flavobacteriales bacterium]|nr:MAG: hypothetical protein CSA39_04505 [Flavobacteriales bacterium]
MEKEVLGEYYTGKSLNKLSWHHPILITSTNLTKTLNISFTDAVIDIDGGDSFLACYLLKMGYTNITVSVLLRKILFKINILGA